MDAILLNVVIFSLKKTITYNLLTFELFLYNGIDIIT